MARRRRPAATRLAGSRRSTRHRRSAATGLIFDLGVRVEIRLAIDVLHRSKAGVEQSLSIFLDGNRTGDAAHIRQNLLAHLWRKILLERDVAHGQASARLEHAG